MAYHSASPEQLEREIAATRADIDRKVALLQQRLSPRAVAGQVAGSVQAQGGAFLRNLGAAMRDNPVPTLLVGIGLCWLILASRSNGRATRFVSHPEAAGVAEAADTAEPVAPLSHAEAPSLPPRTAAAMAAAEEASFPSRGLASGQG